MDAQIAGLVDQEYAAANDAVDTTLRLVFGTFDTGGPHTAEERWWYLTASYVNGAKDGTVPITKLASMFAAALLRLQGPEVERLRTALRSAQGRAAGYRDECDQVRAELAQMSKAYVEVCQSLQVLRGDLP